jgi:hypothetical protein
MWMSKERFSGAFDDFRERFEPLENNLQLLTDKCTGARYCECHIEAKRLISLGTTTASLDSENPHYKANREVDLNHQAFLKMKHDAKMGRSFSNIVTEYREDVESERPLKIIGGQHRFEAIRSAQDRNEYHGVKVYFSLDTEQRADVALISNTNITISKDLIDRIHETVTGGKLRDWCQSVGLLKPNQQFTDRYKRGGAISVQMAKTFVTNYYAGKSVAANEFADTDTTAEKCPAGQLHDESWERLENENPNLLGEHGLSVAAREFAGLIKAQRDSFSRKTPKPRPDMPEKALNLAVLGAWAYVAGHLQSNPKRLERHYDLAKAKNHDPLNAAALAQGKHKTDPQNYWGLGYRTDPKERGRLVELFHFQASEGGGINKHAVEVAMADYQAKQSIVVAKKIRAQGD